MEPELASVFKAPAFNFWYNLPSALTKKIKIERVRLYARALNLFTITKYEGWDPEVNADFLASANNIYLGQDFYSAPQIKSIVFGVNISL